MTSITNGNGISGGDGGSEGAALTITIDATTTGTTSTTYANSGLEVTAGGLRLLGGCSDGQILNWDATDVRWECATNTAGSSDWTQAAGTPNLTYLTDTSSDFVIGGSTLAASMFGIDEDAGNFYSDLTTVLAQHSCLKHRTAMLEHLDLTPMMPSIFLMRMWVLE